MERKICEECGGKIIKKKVDHYYLEEFIGNFPAEVCQKCGEVVFDEDVSRTMTRIVQFQRRYIEMLQRLETKGKFSSYTDLGMLQKDIENME